MENEETFLLFSITRFPFSINSLFFIFFASDYKSASKANI